jgi:uncharacterized protein DUF4406
MILYIAGPMAGIPHDNHPAFKKTKALLENEGHTVISPLDMDEYDENRKFDIAKSFHNDLRAVCLEVDGVIVLPGWESSDGASIEAMTARRVKKPVWELSVFLLYGKDGVRL